MDEPLVSLEEQVKAGRNYDTPPLDLWHPALSGDIPIHIDAQGDWYHEGVKIERQSLVRLFASILRREEDGEYYLVTPSEKWRITVTLHPLIITDIDVCIEESLPTLEATLNTGRRVRVCEENSLFLEPGVGNVAAIKLSHGLTALCTRSAWYRLVELATAADREPLLKSGSYEFRLSPD